ncbi:MAG: RHS repeat-associated core domain-containing protein [Verrucomicrobiales bacterium]|nr:RHS repeat-associated core domain-containing protein [Verrucomicrobiales bacterium]
MALIRQYPGEPPKFDALTYRQIEHANNRQGEIVNTKDPNETIHAYDRDTLGRLLHDRITRETGGEVVHTYWSDRWKPLEERIDSATTAARQYLWGERPGHRDELVLRDRDTDGNGTLDERLYATMDYFNGTTVLDTSGAVQERYGYSAFGVRRVMAADFTPKTGSDYDWEFGFQGQFRDEETGWLNYGYRFYVPELGRWINRDLIQEAGGMNLYAFTNNSPGNSVDIFGLIRVYAGYEISVEVTFPCFCGSVKCGEKHATGTATGFHQKDTNSVLQKAVQTAVKKANAMKCKETDADCGCADCKGAEEGDLAPPKIKHKFLNFPDTEKQIERMG